MPRLGGLDLATRLRASIPGLAVVYMSGYADRLNAGAGVLKEGAAELIEKPFSGAALGRALRAAIERSRPG